MKRVKLKEPMVFDITERMRVLHGMEDFVFRVRVDENGIKIWKRATQGNLDAPRPLDKFIQLSWEQVGKSGDAYHGSRDGHVFRGPASGRNGLRYLTHKNK
jgi:hypothetical protein